MSQSTPISIPLLHGRYRIEEQLGAGRLAVVYRAYDERLQRQVLVHMLRKELLGQEALRQRFIQEAHSNARRSHQSLLEVFDSGEIAGRPYMITEYVAGRTLRELGALSLEEALLYFRQLVGAVAAAQAAGVPHPPITANNVILVEDGHVELLENWRTSAAEVALDAACYRAPERTAGGPATSAAAVYSLGLLLIEMLTGRRVIEGDDPRAVAQAHLSARIPRLSEIRPLLYSPALDELIQLATARDPSQRTPDATSLGAALDALRRDLSGDTRRLDRPPVQPPGLRERINRSTGRMAAPRSIARPEPAAVPRRAYTGQSRRRSIAGMAIVLAMLTVFACAGYYGISVALDRLTNFELPRPALDLPALPDLGIDWPSWLTGVVGGRGQVLVVTGVPDEGLNLRAGPGLNMQVVALLPNTTRVRALDGPRVVDGVPWMHVRATIADQDVEGWASLNFLKPE
ncbi:MAG TPA: protein kinase [Roseiflexaceae bacterium]|nr:protein kinase [Roseiflexaceae bacterium]